jgi:iron complex transport system substrate-binding protein
VAALLLTAACGGGEQPVPAAPQRVVAIGDHALELVLALGVVPVAVDDAAPDSSQVGPPGWLNTQFPELAGLSTFAGENDVTAIAKAKPDLIIADGRSSTSRERLTKVAAVLSLPGGTVDEFGIVANALGRQAEAGKIRQDRVDALERLRTEVIPDGGKAPSVSVVRWTAAGPTSTTDGSLRRLLTDAGLTVTAGVPGIATPSTYAPFDADHVFVGIDWSDPGDAFTNPVKEEQDGVASGEWQALPAVAAQRSTGVDGSLWFPNAVPGLGDGQQLGPLAQLLVLQQVQDALSGAAPSGS